MQQFPRKFLPKLQLLSNAVNNYERATRAGERNAAHEDIKRIAREIRAKCSKERSDANKTSTDTNLIIREGFEKINFNLMVIAKCAMKSVYIYITGPASLTICSDWYKLEPGDGGG